MPDWNPALYRRYEDQRTRSAQELLARVPLTVATQVVDLCCGPGNSTELLVQRFPQAQVTGIDHSQAMLDSARKRLPAVHFLWGDIATWTPAALHSAVSRQAPYLFFANAALHWVPGHTALIPRLFAALRCVAQTYSVRADGQRLLAFPRLCVVAQRKP